MRNNLRLTKQKGTINKVKGILITDKSVVDIGGEREVALVEVDRRIQFYNFNNGLSIDVIEAIVEISKNFETIYESLKQIEVVN